MLAKIGAFAVMVSSEDAITDLTLFSSIVGKLSDYCLNTLFKLKQVLEDHDVPAEESDEQ